MAKSFKLFVVLCVFAVFAAAEDVSTDKFDNVDVDEALATGKYHDCLFLTGPCLTPDAQFYREHLAYSIYSGCKKCSPKQKMNFKKIAEHYATTERSEWRTVVAKHIAEQIRKSETENTEVKEH